MGNDASLKCKRLCNQVLLYIHQFIRSQWVAVPLLTPSGTLYPHGSECLQKAKRKSSPFIKPRCSFRPPTTKEEMLTQCSFHLNAIPPLPFRASYYRWIILLVWTIAGRIGLASSAKSILHALPAGIFFFQFARPEKQSQITNHRGIVRGIWLTAEHFVPSRRKVGITLDCMVCERGCVCVCEFAAARQVGEGGGLGLIGLRAMLSG